MQTQTCRIATTVAFALLWMSTSPAFSEQGEHTLPSLTETEKFINRHGVSDALTMIKPEYGNAASKGSLISMDIRFEVMNCKAKSTLTYSVNNMETEEETENPTQHATREQFSHAVLGKIGKNDSFSQVTPEYWLKFQFTHSNLATMTVGYFDAVMGPRMKTAIDHWLDLCGGGPEPF